MGLEKCDLDPKSHLLIALGCASLSIAIVLRCFVHPAELMDRILLDMLIGSLFGLFIGLELFAAKAIYNSWAERA